MQRKILLDNTQIHFSPSDLPCLIHGVDHAGASLFTVTMMADLYGQSYPLLFINGYHMARDEFISQTEISDEFIHLQKEEQFSAAISKKVIFIQRENIGVLQSFVNILPDYKERVVLLKNFDLFDESVFKTLMDSQYLILSGNLDSCAYTEEIIRLPFKTKIFFSTPQTQLQTPIPFLQKYQGYVIGDKRTGFITLK